MRGHALMGRLNSLTPPVVSSGQRVSSQCPLRQIVPLGHEKAATYSPSGPHVCTSLPLHTTLLGTQPHFPALHAAPPSHGAETSALPSARHVLTALAPSHTGGAVGSHTRPESASPPVSMPTSGPGG